jgi:hypothetical protein
MRFPQQKADFLLISALSTAQTLDEALWAVFEGFGRPSGHTSGQLPVHAAAIAGLSRLPRRIRL